jgi:cytochrome c oxidase accessory protein FixG
MAGRGGRNKICAAPDNIRVVQTDAPAQVGRDITDMPQPTKEPSAPPDEKGAVQKVNWDDFREHLATADQEGRRLWIYPKQPRGRFYTARKWVSYALIAIMFAGPFIKINGNPLLMINIVERKFSVLGVIFWPQDNLIFAFGLLLFLTGIAVFTAAFGRLWCGWTCPQTVMMEMVFRRLEYLIEGDAHQQRALAKAPWTGAKLAKKLLKHGLFFGLSFIIGNTLLAYIIGIDALKAIVTDDPRNHLTGLTFMILFTLLFYAIFARFREQACTFICPYGRFQSTLLDENTIVVAYDHKRGERRAPLRRNQSLEERRAAGAGDCINCRECVNVCPTGIDIRNGTQMECVNCTACIDACDNVMDKIGRPRGLIRFASLNGIERGEPLRITPRIIGYTIILCLLGAGLATLLLTRSDVDVTMLRAPGAVYQLLPGDRASNLYLVKLTNKTNRDLPVDLRLVSPEEGKLTVLGGVSVLPRAQQTQASVLVELPRARLVNGNAPLEVTLYIHDQPAQKLKTTFVGPR